MRRWGIQRKVFFLALVPTMVLMVVIGVYFTHTWIHNLSQMLEQRGHSLSRQLASASEYGTFTGNRDLLFGLASSMLEERGVRAITIYDRDGSQLVQTGPRQRLKPPELIQGVTGSRMTHGDTSSLFLSPIFPQDLMIDGLMGVDGAGSDTSSDNTPLGWVSVELSHAIVEKEQYQALLVSLLVIGGGLILNGLIAVHLSRSVTDPVHELTRGISRLREGRLDTRIAINASPELEELAAGLNAMALSQQRAQDEMQQNVDQATEDLRETLETIEVQNIELDLARKQALEASRIKSEFLANMSHEIRTPLNGIIGFTDLLLKSPSSSHQRDHLNTIRKSSEILLTIINDILDFSKIEAGKLVLDRTPYRLRDTIEEVLVMLAPAAHDKDLDLVPLVYDDVPDELMGDPLRIKQVITNLINNAIKFTQNGEVVLRAMVDDDADDNPLIRISVTDTGVGLSRSQQESLFNAFNQGDRSTARQYGGTGLGLVISRRLVEQMGGEIEVESELGKGSCFWFSLPAEIAGDLPESGTHQGLRNERALYLEYQTTTGIATENLLQQCGLRITRVQDCDEVVSAVQRAQGEQQGFAVVLIGLTGNQVHSSQHRELIRRLEYECDCRVLLLTPTLNVNTSGLIEMASGHLTKPVRRNHLFDKLHKLVHGELPSAAARTTNHLALLPECADNAPRILAVDDNEANLKLIVTLLRDLNLNVQPATSGYETLRYLQYHEYDLVFMDVQMPGMDGTETTARIRTLDNNNARLPVVALTAHALSEEREQLLASGFDGYLTKPISQSLIVSTLERQMGASLRNRVPKHSSPPADPIRPSARTREQPIVDPHACVRLAGGKVNLAEELLSMLLDHVEHDHVAILAHHENNEREALLERVHKLHGATRYAGVPELRTRAGKLESMLKRGETELEAAVEALLAAIDRLENWCRQTNWQEQLRGAATESQPGL